MHLPKKLRKGQDEMENRTRKNTPIWNLKDESQKMKICAHKKKVWFTIYGGELVC